MNTHDLLIENEKLVFDLRPHWIELVPPAFWTVVSIVGAALLSHVVKNSTGKDIIWASAALAIIVLGVVPYLRWRYTHFILTSDRIITRKGVLAKHSKEIPLERINDVSFHQSVFERVVGAGDLLLESAGERGQERIEHVRKPQQVHLMIYKETEDNANRMTGGSSRAAPAGPAITDQIAELAKLRDAGTITPAEFESKKAELLKRM